MSQPPWTPAEPKAPIRTKSRQSSRNRRGDFATLENILAVLALREFWLSSNPREGPHSFCVPPDNQLSQHCAERVDADVRQRGVTQWHVRLMQFVEHRVGNSNHKRRQRPIEPPTGAGPAKSTKYCNAEH